MDGQVLPVGKLNYAAMNLASIKYNFTDLDVGRTMMVMFLVVPSKMFMVGRGSPALTSGLLLQLRA